MWKSTLLINVGDNPDQPRPGRLWLRNLYHVHQRLCMAFPTAERQRHDSDFLKPYKPDDFPEDRYLADRKQGDGNQEVSCEVLKQVHRPRDDNAGFLFRIDPQPGGRVVIVVQSAREPRWDYAFGLKEGLLDERGRPIGNAGYLLTAPPEKKEFHPDFPIGKRLRFRLQANPTRRVYSKDSRERDGRPVEARWVGKRIPVPHDQLLNWLADWRVRIGNQPQAGGFSIDQERTSVQSGYVYVNEGRDGGGHRLFSARYDGVLEVTDAEKFRNTLIRGIGSGKAFGFGLLSVAPCAIPPAEEAM